MTTIVGIVRDGIVTIGADSAGSNGEMTTIRKDRKLFRKGEMVIGYTSSYRMGQLLQYHLSIPFHHKGVDDMEYMVTEFVPAVRACLSEGGWAKKESEQEEGGTFLVGYRGHLYEIDSDYQVEESADEYNACGGGYIAALGALNVATQAYKDTGHILGAALRTAAKITNDTRPPFHYEATTLETEESDTDDAVTE